MKAAGGGFALVAFAFAIWAVVSGLETKDRLQVLEDKDAIRTLILDYGRDVDARDWDGFVTLFAKNGGTWDGGMGVAVGRAAIKDMMVKSMGTAPNGDGISQANLHILSNEIISVDGDHGKALTKWVFVMTGPDKAPEPVFIGHYVDDLVRENGAWKFQRRTVKGDIMKANVIKDLTGK